MTQTDDEAPNLDMSGSCWGVKRQGDGLSSLESRPGSGLELCAAPGE